MNRHEIETAAREAFGGEPEPIESRSSDWRVIIGLFALLLAAIGLFVWWGLA